MLLVLYCYERPLVSDSVCRCLRLCVCCLSVPSRSAKLWSLVVASHVAYRLVAMRVQTKKRWCVHAPVISHTRQKWSARQKTSTVTQRPRASVIQRTATARWWRHLWVMWLSQSPYSSTSSLLACCEPLICDDLLFCDIICLPQKLTRPTSDHIS